MAVTRRLLVSNLLLICVICAGEPRGAAARTPPPAAGRAAAAAPRAPASTCRPGQLQAIVAQARALREGELSFWLKHGLDREHGGFHATMDRGGVAGEPSDKGLVQQARHVWTFSHAAASGLLRPADAAAAEAAARSAWAFMADHMQRAERGTWRWLVSRDGRRVVQDGPNVYGQWFVVYAATQYYKAFGDRGALALALATFNATDAAFHDARAGGYREDGSAPQLGKLRLAGGGPPRSLNVLLHGTEALAALYEASGDAAVLARLTESLRLATRLVTADDVLYEFYDPATWAPVGPTSVQWGHNLESAWLMTVSADMLRRRGALSPTAAAAYTDRVAAVAARAAREGYDAASGGVYEAGVPGSAPGQGKGASTDKVWWVQAEALLALWQLHARAARGGAGGAGAACAYLDQLEGTLKFIAAHLVDPADGGVLWSVGADGAQPGSYMGTRKGSPWKASYHAGRALMLLEEWAGAAGAAAGAGGRAAGGGAGGAAAGGGLADAALRASGTAPAVPPDAQEGTAAAAAAAQRLPTAARTKLPLAARAASAPAP
ncbi:MAG: Six-hairpin glycosidase-like protein [Monoraphidium minutum]|nr:MAG: Six-hairpin glycosidase-like protein [Monoraphidium minutum]